MKKNICGDVKMAHIATRCRCCKNIIQIPCSDETYVAAQFWNAATDPRPIQEVFPDMSPENREMFVSGICPTCWNVMFGEEDETE